MTINEFIANYKNHPVLFVGTGVSLRYLENSYTWDGLLSSISYELTNSEEYYLDLKANSFEQGRFKPEKVAMQLENKFNTELHADRNGKFVEVNDIFYANMRRDVRLSRFKIYIGLLFSKNLIREEKKEEVLEFKKIRKNIGCIVTTNYDHLIEEIFEFNPLIGNDILLSNPYGSVYKIHGCSKQPDKIIITESDYKVFDDKYDLIRAQLLSLFIHNPIIFLGYGVGDENIKKILRTIFTYVEPNSELANQIRNNFLLVEYEKGSDNINITEHDIDIAGLATIRIHKIKTDNFLEVYRALSDIHLPISAMDVRKVQSVVKEIYAGGDIMVSITEDLESMRNSDRILAIGSSKTISYQYHTSAEMIAKYFIIMDESNFQLVTLIDKFKIEEKHYFPIFGFSKLNEGIKCADRLQSNQRRNIQTAVNAVKDGARKKHYVISEIEEDDTIPSSYKGESILWNCMEGNIDLNDVEKYLRTNIIDSKVTNFRKILCAYDMRKYDH